MITVVSDFGPHCMLLFVCYIVILPKNIYTLYRLALHFIFKSFKTTYVPVQYCSITFSYSIFEEP